MQGLKELRETYGFSVKEFSEILGLKKRTYENYELGVNAVPSDLLNKIKGIFNKNNSDVRLEGMIDYLRIRFKTLNYLSIVDSLLKLSGKPFSLLEKGRYAYDDCYVFNNIKVYFSETDEDMGCLLELSGMGCREFEFYLEGQKRTWFDFFHDVFEFEKASQKENFVKITRVDIALDEKYSSVGNYNLYSLKEKHDAGLIKKKARSFKFIDGIKNNRAQGCSVYFGSRQAGVLLNFYEKDLEQADKLGLPVEEVREQYGFRNRYEVRFSDVDADNFIRNWYLNREDLAKLAVGVINDKIHVYDLEDGKKVLSVDWYKLMGDMNSVRFKTEPKEEEIGKKQYRWFEKSVAPTILFILELEKLTGERRMDEILSQAEIPLDRLKELQYLKEVVYGA